MSVLAAALPLENPLRMLYLGEQSPLARQFLKHLEALELCAKVHRLSDQAKLESTLARVQPDLVLVDFGITDASRREYVPAPLLRRLKEQPVVAVTVAEREYRGIAAMQLGAQDYLCIDHQDDADLEDVIWLSAQRNLFFQRLAQPEHSVRSVLYSINDGVIVIDRDGLVISLNPAGRSILGVTGRASPDAEWCQTFCSHSAKDGRLLTAAERPLTRALDGGKFSAMDVMHRTPGHPDLILSVSGQGLTGEEGTLIGAMLTFRDTTERYRQSAELARLSSYDNLTGLANRRLFENQLDKAIGRSKRAQRSLSVLFIDLDRFKSVNDTLGHDVGDRLLIDVANRLSNELRVGDLICRWGGDEFVVALENVSTATDAAAVAQKLCLALSEKYCFDDVEAYITPSIGIAQYPTCGDSVDVLIRAADAAMYQAKKRGTGRFHFHSAGDNQQFTDADELEVGLRHALVRREFVLHYQPRVDATHGRLVGLEALLRWQHPRFGLLQPARFLSILETSGLIFSVGEWVIDEACRQLKAWQNRFDLPDLSVTVNISPHQLMRGRLLEAVSRTLDNTTLDPGCLELEIDEAILSDRRNRPMETLNGLSELGVRLSVDHFGTRDISFRSLDQGIINTFVLHHSLITDLDTNPGHQRIVRATIAMARGLDIEVGAGGVETVQQYEFLQDCECSLLQGNLISRPVQADAVTKMLATHLAV